MPRLESLSEVLRQVLLTFPCLEYDTTPWTPLWPAHPQRGKTDERNG